MKFPAKLSISIAALLAAVVPLSVTRPARAFLFEFDFAFTDSATGTPVSGTFLFDNSVDPIVTDMGAFFGNASPTFSLEAGSTLFEGGANSIVVADNFVMPGMELPPLDVLIFDDFVGFDPTNLAAAPFLGLFLYGADTLQSEAIPTEVPEMPLLTIVTDPTGQVFTAGNAMTSVTPVPEPVSILTLLGMGVLGAGICIKARV